MTLFTDQCCPYGTLQWDIQLDQEIYIRWLHYSITPWHLSTNKLIEYTTDFSVAHTKSRRISFLVVRVFFYFSLFFFCFFFLVFFLISYCIVLFFSNESIDQIRKNDSRNSSLRFVCLPTNSSVYLAVLVRVPILDCWNDKTHNMNNMNCGLFWKLGSRSVTWLELWFQCDMSAGKKPLVRWRTAGCYNCDPPCTAISFCFVCFRFLFIFSKLPPSELGDATRLFGFAYSNEKERAT